jgi:hypothetical protein
MLRLRNRSSGVRSRGHFTLVATGLARLVDKNLAALAVLMCVLADPLAAHAQPTVINFDDLPAGTLVSTQYHKLGLDLDSGNFGSTLPITAALSSAPSLPNVLNISTNSPVEFPGAYVQGTFTNPHHSAVFAQIGSQAFGGTRITSLIAYDLSNNVVASQTGAVPELGGFVTFFLFAPNSDIARFEVTSDNTNLFIDDLSFDTLTTPPAPDFALAAPNVLLAPGGSATTTIIVKRFAGSAGPILLIAGQLPTGVQVDGLVPNPSDGPDGATSLLTLSADASAAAVQNWPFKLTGIPSPTAGQFGAHSITVPLTILDTYNAQVVGIEITQGIQVYNLPAGSSNNQPLHGTPIRYEGVGLAEGGKTIARVFANFAAFPEGSAPPLLECRLYGFRDGVSLPGSPMAPENDFNLILGANSVDNLTRANLPGIRFTLPASWTSGTITLKAVIEPAPSFIQPVSFDCCPDNDSFTLTDITFTSTRDLLLAPFALRVNQSPLLSPDVVFDDARNLLPIGDTQFHIDDYEGDVDITDIWNQDVKGCGFLNFSSCAEDATGRGASVAARLRDFADDANFTDSGELVVGIFPQSVSGVTGRIRSNESRDCTGPFWDCDALAVIAVQEQKRPRTSVAHELGHMLGRPHASYAGGAGDTDHSGPAERWPPDEMGLIQGVGFDRRTFQILFPDPAIAPVGGSNGCNIAPAGPLGAQIYDFMSYCPKNNPDGRDSWISVRGWGETLGAVDPKPGAALGTSSSTKTPARLGPALGAPVLNIQAFIDRGNAYITKVAPGRRRLVTTPSSSPFLVVAFDKSGRTTSVTDMAATIGHIDDGGIVNFVDAQVPVETAAFEIREYGALIARRARSKHAPTISGVEVEPGVRVSQGDDDGHGDDDDGEPCRPLDDDDRAAATSAVSCVMIVKWRASDADGDKLTAKLDYSTDKGRTWRPLFFGPNHNRAVLSAALFNGSQHGLVRVRINDGFNEIVALSREFVAAGAPPVVHITSPLPGTTIRSAAALYLSGNASDQNHAPITRTDLQWYAGDGLLGTGETLSVSGLPSGTTEIRLMARDARGLTTTRSVVITIVP